MLELAVVAVTLGELLPIISAIVVGVSGFVGGIYALLKLRPESGQITVLAAQGAVQAQVEVMNQLRAEMGRMDGRLTSLENERARLDQEVARLRNENLKLRERILHLEEEIYRLKQREKENG